MQCAICHELSPDLYDEVDGESVYFHFNCALCYVCGKPTTAFSRTPEYDFIFMHEACIFTPEQASDLLRLQAEYTRSHDH